MTRSIVIGGVLALSSATGLLADFQYTQTTKITGGMMAGMMKMAGAFSKQAREPMVSTIYVKGNRMAHVSQRHAQVTDLDKETITDIDFYRKTYSVMTFQQMKQAFEDAVAKAKQEKSEGSENADVSFRASVRKGNQPKPIAGYDTKEFILDLIVEGTDKKTQQKGAMTMSSDMWMASGIKGYQEVRDFHMKMAAKLGMILGDSGFNPMQMGRPDMAKGMSDMAKEMSKLEGVPVLTIMRMGSMPDGKPLPAASEAPDLAKSEGPNVNVKEAAAKSAQDSAVSSTLGRLGGIGGGLGGKLGGLGRKKQQEQPQEQPQQQQQQQAQAAGPAILMESQTESSDFSTNPVDASKFEPPAGFKQVDPETRRRGR